LSGSATAIAAAVAAGETSARAVTEQALDRIAAGNPAINAFTRILSQRALAEADAVDAGIARGDNPGPLAGVPYGVKDLFDIAGLPTTAGAAMRRSSPVASVDAVAVQRMTRAGAVLVGTLNMDEYAYGFATDNSHWGITRNPHDHRRLAGGSSGGSAAAVSSGLVPLALGSDTNGSVRIPAGLCGVHGLKPSHASLPMTGVFPFADSFDDVGAFAATAADLALVHAVLAGATAPVPSLGALRVARLGGWFERNADAAVLAGIAAVAAYLGGSDVVDLPEVERARAAAFLITAAEGGNLHLPALRETPMAFDPATRDRLLAGALQPAAGYIDAQRFRSWFAERVAAVFDAYDVLLAPVCTGVAPLIDQPTIEVDGKTVSARANLGIYTQPLSFVGLPVVAAPLRRPGLLPIGIQLIARPGNDALLFAVAAELEAAGLTGASPLP